MVGRTGLLFVGPEARSNGVSLFEGGQHGLLLCRGLEAGISGSHYDVAGEVEFYKTVFDRQDRSVDGVVLGAEG